MALLTRRRDVAPEIYEAADRRIMGMAGPMWTMALWFGLTAVVMAISLLFPAPPNHSPLVRFLAMVYAGAVVLLLLLMRERTPMAFIHVQLVLYILIAIRIITLAGTPASAITTGMNFMVLAVYLGWWIPRLPSLIYIGAANLGLLFGFWRADFLPELAIAWLAIAALSMGLVIAFGALVWNLKVQLVTDPLTGLLNRQGLGALIDRRAHKADEHAPRALIAIDLDHFKSINDLQGHLAGDRTLADFGAALRRELRPHDIAFRVGGDEFVVVLPRTSVADAQMVAARLRQGIPIAWSYGVTDWGLDEEFSRASARADAQMYADKAGREGPGKSRSSPARE